MISSIAALFLILPAASGCTRGAADMPVVNGTVDVSSMDFVKDGRIELSGQWEFYPGILLSPGDFVNKSGALRPCYITVPSMWKNNICSGSAINVKGAATYRLMIITGSDTSEKVFVFNQVYSGYRVWINGILMDEKGMPDSPPGKERHYVFIHNRTILPFTPDKAINEIVLQVSNRDYPSGGIGMPPFIGSRAHLERAKFIRHTVEMIIVGLVLFFSLYNFLFYFSRRENNAALYTGLFCLAFTVNVFNLSMPLLSGPLAFPRNPYLVDYVSVIVIIFFVMMTVKALFPQEFSRSVARINQYIALFFITTILLSDFRMAEKLASMYFVLMVLVILYCFYVFCSAIKNRRGDSVLFFAGFIPLFAGGINDVLYALWIIKTGNIAHYSMVILCFTTTLVIARRYSRDMVRLTRDIRDKNASLEKMDKIKDQFLASTSHELRTPLHGMIGLSEAMLQGAAGDLSSRARENLALIASSGHRLSGMVNDLLDMAKIQDNSLSLDLRPVDLYTLSAFIVKLSLPLRGGKPVDIINSIRPDMPAVFADEDRVRQVLHNLVGNAVKFTNRGKIEVSARVIETDEDRDAGSMVAVSVSDTGIGVPPEFRETIFEAYRQVEGTDSRSYGGTGLGLAIAKQIVGLHGGTIGVEPGETEGSVFTFTLPVSSEPVSAIDENIVIESISDTAAIHESAETKSVTSGEPFVNFTGSPVFLAVDDDPLNITVLQNFLEARDCTVKTARDGITALDMLENDSTIDLVLLDIMMPGMSGYEVCRRIRATRSSEDLPVIMLTAKNMMSDINAAFEAGANDYIVKPFQAAELLARVNTMLMLRNIRRTASSGITIKLKNRTIPLLFSEIVYITSDAKKVILHTEKQDMELPVLMKEIIHRLPPDIFIRIHKSHVINTTYLKAIEHVQSGRYRVCLSDDDDTRLPVGPAYKDIIANKFS